MEILSTLSESRMFRSKNAVERISARQAVDLFHMHICALTILRLSHTSERWAKDYARRTMNYGMFREWRTNSTDLGILGWAILTEDVDLRLPTTSNRLRERLTVDQGMVERWVKNVQSNNFDDGLTKRMFSRLDLWLRVEDESLRAIRRLVQDWTDLDTEEAQLCVTRLLQLLRSHGSKMEILDQLNLLATQYGLELMGVCDPDTGLCTSGPQAQETPKKKGNFFAKVGAVAAGTVLGYQASKRLHNVKEDATAGATSSVGIAPVVGALGSVQRRVMPTTVAISNGDSSKRRSAKKKPK